LTACPDQAVPLIQSRLKLSAPLETKQIRRWVQDLNCNQFAAREKATEELESLGELAKEALQNALENRPAPEMERRLERLLERIRGPFPPVEQMRSIRSVEVLERVGSEEAQTVLKSLTRGDPKARITQEAKTSLQRLATRAGLPR
jgi:hypothetical protein